MSSRVNPFINKFGKLYNIFVKILASYKSKDSPAKHELSITLSMLRAILKLVKSIQDIFIVHLVIGTFFYAIQSCEYTKTNREPRTTIITTDCILFFKYDNN